MRILRRVIKTATRPYRARRHGTIGEAKVRVVLNYDPDKKLIHRTINNLIIIDKNGRSHQIDHVEIRKNGIFCIETKSLEGTIIGDCHSSKWTQILSNGEIYQHFNPIKQNEAHCRILRDLLGDRYIVNSIIVMANDNAAKIASSNVLNVRDLKDYLDNFDNGATLTSEEINNVADVIESYNSELSDVEHIKNIREYKKSKVNDVCPYCGAKLLSSDRPNGVFYLCPNYPTCKYIKFVKM